MGFLMVSLGPPARLRLYTSPGLYARLLAEMVRGRFAKGQDDVTRLEQAVAARVGARHAVAMPMARVGIYFTLKALIKPGQKVILSPYTIADVVNMVICAGGVPLFADIERGSCNIDPAQVEALLAREDNVGAVMVTHFYGNGCKMQAIVAACAARGIPLIEDAAQAFGVTVEGRAAGRHGTAGIYSFGLYKNVNAFYGGMVVTDDDRLAQSLRDEMARLPIQPLGHYLKKYVWGVMNDIITHPIFFQTFFFRFFRFAFLRGIDAINNKLKIDVDPVKKNRMPDDYMHRMSPAQARAILPQLAHVDRDTAARIATAQVYHDALKDIPDLILPPMRQDRGHMYWYFPLQYDGRNSDQGRHDLVAHVLRQGREISESYHRNCAALPCFAEYARDCPNAEKTAGALIYLPTYPRYGLDEARKTAQAIRSYFKYDA